MTTNSTDSSAALFSLVGVCQRRGDKEVLHDLTLDLPARRLVSIIGPSGAGKSSLIRLLNRLDDPTKGAISFQGADIAALPVRALRRRVGFVFQSPTMFPGTVADNLRASARHGGTVPPQEMATTATLVALLASVELDAGFLDRDAGGLSGGEQQRVGIARALTTVPEVLVLDEPTSALDPEVAERFMGTVARLNREQTLSVIMVTHRLAEARQFSDVTIMLDGGRVVESGETARLFDSPKEARTRAFVQSAK